MINHHVFHHLIILSFSIASFEIEKRYSNIITIGVSDVPSSSLEFIANDLTSDTDFGISKVEVDE